MKKTLRFSITALLVVLAVGIMSFTAGKNAAAKEMAAGEGKKLTNIVYFTYDSANTDAERKKPENYTPVTSSLCPSGTSNFCGISFDADQSGYGLNANGEPNATFLTNQVAAHYNDGGPTDHTFTVNSVIYYRKP